MHKNRNPATGASSARFWNYEEATGGEPAVLRLDGVIASESWWGDEVTPAMFREELEAHPGDIVVYINSPGGDVYAGSQIYTMLMEHKGNVTVKIEGIAASAASVIAMAGTDVQIAPTAYMMIHNAWAIAAGNKNEMRHEADVLEEIDKGIREAYHIKTGLRTSKLAQMMEDETWMSARTALELGFVDSIMARAATAADPDEDDEDDDPDEDEEERKAVAADPDEDEDGDEDDPDEDDEREEKLHTALLRHVPAVAWSPRQQTMALRRQLRFEEVCGAASQIFDLSRGSSAEGGTGFASGQSRLPSANHNTLRELLNRHGKSADSAERQSEDDTDEMQRRKLQLLTL